MYSLSRYFRQNQISKIWIEESLNEAHSYGLTSIRAHVNVLAFADSPEKLKQTKNDVGSQLALMECKPRHNTVDVSALFWAGIPAAKAISLRRKVFIRLSKTHYASLSGKPITKARHRLSASKWRIG
jgi:type IV secretory pathway VirB4 component